MLEEDLRRYGSSGGDPRALTYNCRRSANSFGQAGEDASGPRESALLRPGLTPSGVKRRLAKSKFLRKLLRIDLTSTLRLGLTTTANTMALEYRVALPEDVAECLDVRGRTRENAISAEGLRARGITLQSWAEDVRQGALPGHVCLADGKIIGFCFGVRESGEVAVLAPESRKAGAVR